MKVGLTLFIIAMVFFLFIGFISTQTEKSLCEKWASYGYRTEVRGSFWNLNGEGVYCWIETSNGRWVEVRDVKVNLNDVLEAKL